MSRTCSTSSIQREVIQAKGQRGSNQKSARSRVTVSEVIWGQPGHPGGNIPDPGWHDAAPCLEPTSLGTRRRPARGCSSVDSYAVELDLTRRDLVRLHHDDRLHAAPSPARRPSPTSSAPPSRTIRLNGAVLDPDEVYVDNRIQLERPPGRPTGSSSRAHLPYSRTGEGLHRFVDPADKRVYTYTQFEVPDARRVYTTFEQPDLKSVFTFHVQAPEDWVVVSNAPTPEPEPRGDGTAVWRFPPTERMSTYITAIIAGEYHAEHTTYEGKFGTIPLGHYCRQSLVEHLDADALRPASPSRASRSSRRPSTTPTRSTSTTSSTCRSTTWARWRTPAP